MEMRMSLIIKNVAASNKLLLPNGKPLKIGAEIKVSESIMGSSLIRKLISEGKISVRPSSAKAAILDVIDVVKEVVETVALTAVNPVAAVTNVADIVAEVQEAVTSVSDAVQEDSSLTILQDSESLEEVEEKPKSRRRTSKKEEE
jgi:hypothetical protein